MFLAEIILPVILAFMMFTMGADLKVDDFKSVIKFPKAFVLGITLQFFTLPVFAFGISSLAIKYGLDPIFAVGVMILAVCPGGVTSNMLTHLTRGDSALSVSLTGVSSFISVITLPILVTLSLNHFIGTHSVLNISIFKMTVGIFIITIVPLICGMLFKYFKNTLGCKVEPTLRKLSSLFFILIVVFALAKDIDLVIENFIFIAPTVGLLNLATMLTAFFTTKIFNLSPKQSIAIVYECGLQNGTLAIFIALNLLSNEKFLYPAVIYSFFMYLNGFLFYLIQKKKLFSSGVRY